MRIVSLVPSLTEFLYDLELEESVVGITKFCIHPEKWFREKTRIGGTKNPKIDAIIALKPDLVIANKEENRKEDVEALLPHCKVLVTDINNFDEMQTELQTIANLVGKSELGKEVISATIGELENIIPLKQKRTCAYLIWNDPIMSVQHPTFIQYMLDKVGLNNVVPTLNAASRYPELTENQLKELNPEVLMLSSEPFPFKEKHLIHYQKLLPNGLIIKVDGELFSWYGSRLKYFNKHWEALRSVIEKE